MITIGIVWLTLTIVVLPFACWLDHRRMLRIARGEFTATVLSVVCMDCGTHISGPPPTRPRYVSHDLCKACAAKRKRELQSFYFKAPVLPASRWSHQ